MENFVKFNLGADFLLSIEEIKNASFKKARFGGYKAQDVDAFLDDIQTSYEEMMRENRNLALTVQKLERELKKFRDEESSIKEVIVNLKSITEKSICDAETRAKEVISDASKASEKMIIQAKKEVATEKEILSRLKKESGKLKADLEDIYKKNMEIIKKIPESETETKFSDILSEFKLSSSNE